MPKIFIHKTIGLGEQAYYEGRSRVGSIRRVL